MIHYNIDSKVEEKFLSDIKEKSKKLKGESKQFIKDMFNTSKKGFSVPGSYLEEKIRTNLVNKNINNLEEIFPESIYPALDLLIGEENREKFLEICRRKIEYPYTVGYYRRMIRSKNYAIHFKNMWRLLEDFVTYKLLDLDIFKLIKREYDKDKFYTILNSDYISYEIDNNEDVVKIIEDMILSDNNTAILNYDIIKGIIKSHNRYLVELLGKLLLAAKLQEGLRQAICENIDSGTQENFNYMFKIVYDNNLLRYSSVKRALGTWLGISEENGDRISKKELDSINKLIGDENYINELLKSESNIDVYLALWRLGNKDVTLAVEKIEEIIKTGKRHHKLLCSYYLNNIQNENLSQKVAKDVIAEYPEDLEILACYLGFLMKNPYSQSADNVDYYFKNKKEADKYVAILDNAITLMSKKEISFSPCIFPWNYESISKERVALALVHIAVSLKEKYSDVALKHFKNIDSFNQERYLNQIITKIENEFQEKTIIGLLSQRTTIESAFDLILSNNLVNKYHLEIESLLRLKSGDTRRNVIRLLLSQAPEDIKISIDNLIGQKDVNKRLGALDLVTILKEKDKISEKEIKSFVKKIEKPTTSEQVLIDELLSNEVKQTEDSLYNMNYEKYFSLKVNEVNGKGNRKDEDNEIIIQNSLSIKDIFSYSDEEIIDIVKKLQNLYVKNEKYEYKSLLDNRTHLLQDNFYPLCDWKEQYKLSDYPLADVWRKFYEEEIKDFKILYALQISDDRIFYYGENNSSYFEDLANKILGKDIKSLSIKKNNLNLKYLGDSYNNSQVNRVIDALYAEYSKENKDFIFEASKAIVTKIYNNFDDEKMLILKKSNYSYIDDSYSNIFNEYTPLSFAVHNFKSYNNTEQFIEQFVIFHNLNMRALEYSKGKNTSFYQDPYDVAYAVKLGLLEKDAYYQAVLNNGNDTKYNIEDIGRIIEEDYGYRANLKGIFKKEVKEVVEVEGQKIIDYIVDEELKRGDMPLKYSRSVTKIYKIYGIDKLISILKALGNLKLDRNSWYWNGGDTKQATLSHLLKVCYPLESDTVEKLKAGLKGTNITEARLTEVAMYAPQWIPILEQYLGWSGLASGCYYFQAHMSDIDKKKEAIFSKYTPISIEDLSVGAFDIDWFKSAYNELGKKNFDMLYESAKYISDGAKHSRARKFADAVLGKFKIKEIEKEIEEKRNKDLVASYGLIPLLKNRDKDLLSRYKFLQKFLKESKQFGAQRRASEAKVFEISLENLARNAGYNDVTRLIWLLETNIIKEAGEYFIPKNIEGTDVYIIVDDKGSTTIVYEKEGKKLKSCPAKIKKHKYIDELKDIVKNLREQYRRSKKMLEEAMENRTEFYAHEIDNLVKNNKVIYPLIKDLVFKKDNLFGYYNDYKLIDADNEETLLNENDKITIAHALDLYNNNVWSKYQKDIFDKGLKQPFKQVFRELYVKTVDELGSDNSLRYAGHQVQPRKTVEILKQRRWIVDDREGLQKVYYKQNIIAKIYALADWFSPADIESPTLEWVQFYDRKSFKPILIDNVDNLIFTEVMRDVDLAVSVAHIGGVDPETSGSTIELRKAIIQFNLPLFKINNVEFTDNYALIKGDKGEYSIHLGSGVIHQKAGSVINVLPVHSQHRGKLFLPFIDEDPKTAEIMSKIILFAEDKKIKDPFILEQIKQR